MKKILVTGATGFIGSNLILNLNNAGYVVNGSVRNKCKNHDNFNEFVIGNIDINSLWGEALHGVHTVIHTASRAHIINESVNNPISVFRSINSEGTLNLAKQAQFAGVKRFIYLSSIGVNGSHTSGKFTEFDEPNPKEDYALSKYEAEQGLLEIAEEMKMEIVIIRPPLVYGPNAPGNFGSIINWASKKILLPLPLGNVCNRRSFVALDNLIDFIILCIDHPSAANEIFLISDGDDVSTTELLRRVATSFEKKSNLFPIPVNIMIFLAKLIGRGDVSNRLFSSLLIDNSKIRNVLGWSPIVTMEEQLKKIARMSK
jgi:nucleoside-diphosphate-sugar epimerase